jgi:hypothetical protein
MPNTIPIGEPVNAEVIRTFGDHYAVITLSTNDQEIPVAFHAITPIPEYQHLWRQFLRSNLAPHDQIVIQSTGSSQEGVLPVLEILDGRGEPLSLFAIRQGWAIPNDSIAIEGVLPETFTQALVYARKTGEGAWGDQDVSGTALGMLSERLRVASNPQPAANLAIPSALGTLVIVFAIILLSVREWWKRQNNQSKPEVVSSKTRRFIKLLAAPMRMTATMVPRAPWKGESQRAFPTIEEMKALVALHEQGQKQKESEGNKDT